MSQKIIHAWSYYELTDDNRARHNDALASWIDTWETGHWIDTPIEPGAIGQDSAHSELRDSKRFPYVHDVIRLACLRANDDNLLCLTRCDTAFQPGITEKLLSGSPCYTFRRLTHPETHHPAADLFCFTKAWWREHQDEYPGRMVMGLDSHWHRILMELVKKHGGKELKGAIYRAHPQAAQRTGPVPKYINHNEGLATAWLAKNGITGMVKPVHEQLPTVPLNRRALHPFGYNPSIIRHNGRLLMAYRWHDEGNPSTALAMAELDANFNVTANKAIQVPQDSFGSHEDARLFVFHGELHISYVCSTWPAVPPKSVVRYGRLEESSMWKVVDSIQPDLGKNDGTAMEKNWLLFEHGGSVAMLYSSGGADPAAEPLRWPWGIIRGGTTPLPYKGKLLSFFHSRLDNEPAPNFWRYAIGARLMEPEPPFATVAISKDPLLRGSENDELTATERSTCHHPKMNVVFPAGAIEHDGGWLLSVGVNDSACALVKVSDKDLNL